MLLWITGLIFARFLEAYIVIQKVQKIVARLFFKLLKPKNLLYVFKIFYRNYGFFYLFSKI